jgi:geranyl-CoA carboxylase alpha subunit
LQVEHAVTEAVTGIDLVEWQLRVARGETLPLTQSEIDARRMIGGHAIEVRLCAEDPQQNFLPQSGVIQRWRAPAGVRTDHALESGLAVSPFYDSMLAKIVAHGRERGDALRKLARALDDCVLLGVKSNRHFLARCIAHPEFAAGHATTAFIDHCFPASARAAMLPDATAQTAAAALLAWQRMHSGAPRYPAELRGWSSSHSYPQLCRFELDGATVSLQIVAQDAQRWEIKQGQQYVPVGVQAAGEGELTLDIGGKVHRVRFAVDRTDIYFQLDDEEHSLIDTTYTAAIRHGAGAGNGCISAPMNGRVVALLIKQGDAVKAGQVLMVIEAMKMEHSIAAPLDGTVAGLFAVIGDQVAPGKLLVEIGAKTGGVG